MKGVAASQDAGCNYREVVAMDTASGIALLIALICAVTDLRRRKIYNVVTLPAIAGGILYHACVNGSQGVMGSLGGVAFGLGIIIVPFLLGGTGAGDSKLLAALGAWMRLPGIVYVFVIAGFACAAASLVLLLIQNMHLLRHPLMALASLSFGILPLPATKSAQPKLPPVVKKSFALPFGLLVAIGVGIVLVFQIAGVASLEGITKGGWR